MIPQNTTHQAYVFHLNHFFQHKFYFLEGSFIKFDWVVLKTITSSLSQNNSSFVRTKITIKTWRWNNCIRWFLVGRDFSDCLLSPTEHCNSKPCSMTAFNKKEEHFETKSFEPQRRVCHLGTKCLFHKKKMKQHKKCKFR